MTLKIPSAMVDDLNDQSESKNIFNTAFDSVAHMAVPAAQPMPFPFTPTQGFYPNVPSSMIGSFSFTPHGEEILESHESSLQPYMPGMMHPMQPIPYPYQPVYARSPMVNGREAFYPTMYYPPMSASLQTLRSQLPSISMPPMVPMITDGALTVPRPAEGMPTPVFGSGVQKSTAVVLNESYLPPAPLTSYLHALGPFHFAMPSNTYPLQNQSMKQQEEHDILNQSTNQK
jgi:hypothetical protein